MKKLLIISMLFASYLGMSQGSIIGKPIRLQKFEVAQYDFIEEMNWKDAKAACASLGKGWRLPTKDELNVMYRYKDKIGGFTNYFYWSSTEYDNVSAWRQGFSNGGQSYGYFKANKYNEAINLYNVRAVRSF